MTARLLATRYDDTDWTGVAPDEFFEAPANVGLRWAVPGGLQRAELTVKANSRFNAYDRYQNHLGHIIAFHDSYLDRMLSGNVYEIVPDGRFVTYIVGGPWKRAHDRFYGLTPFDDMTSATDTADAIKDILDDRVDIENSDQSNILDPTGVTLGGWIPQPKGSLVPFKAAEAIASLAAIGDSSNNPLDFYFVDSPFDGVTLDKPLPYLKARSSTASPDWIFSRSDLAPDGAMLARNIWDLRRNVYINYGRLSGTHTGADAQQTITDAGGVDFRSKVTPGDVVYNLKTGKNEEWRVEEVTGETTLSFNEPDHGGDWDTDDPYTIMLRNPVQGAVSTTAETDLWNPTFSKDYRDLDKTMADELSDQMLAEYEVPKLQRSFVLSSPTIKDGEGSTWPLWRPLFGDSFYFRITDLFPEAALFSTSDDSSQAFMAVALDYTYSDNRLRVVPSTGDSRLDVILNQADLIHGQIISTVAAARDERRRQREQE